MKQYQNQHRPLNLRKVVYNIFNNGYTWEDVERDTGYDRTSIQRKLKGKPVDGPNGSKLEGGHYSTVAGYDRLLAKVHENSKARMVTMNADDAEMATAKKVADAQKAAEKTAKKVADAQKAAEKTAKLAADAKLAAEKANAEAAAAEMEAKLAAKKAEAAKKVAQKTNQKAKDYEKAAKKAAKKAAELEDKLAAELEAKQAAEMEAKLAAEMEAKLAAEMEAKQVAEMEAKQAAEMEAKQVAEKATELETKPANDQPVENTLGKFAVIDTGVLYNLALNNQHIWALYNDFQLVVLPEVCIRELETASKAYQRNPKLSQIARNLLSEISKLGPEFTVLSSEDCAELLCEPDGFNYPVRERSLAIVGALCHIWTNNEVKNSTITLITTTRQVCKLACKQRFPHEVQIRLDEAVFIA